MKICMMIEMGIMIMVMFAIHDDIDGCNDNAVKDQSAKFKVRPCLMMLMTVMMMLLVFFMIKKKRNLASVILTAPSSQRKSSVSLPFKRNAMAATLPT